MPISAHALFSRPLVVAPDSVIAVEVLDGTASGVMWCDGRRAQDLPPRARIEVCRGERPVRLARLDAAPLHRPARGEVRAAGAGLARHVVAGTVGPPPYRRGVLEEIRLRDLGVIDEAVLELSPGLTVVTGETGAGKTMVVTGLSLLLGGRADAALVRPGAPRRS